MGFHAMGFYFAFWFAIGSRAYRGPIDGSPLAVYSALGRGTESVVRLAFTLAALATYG
jgi:hypothetical protein